MKIVINDCFGGFSLSQYAADALGLNTRYPSNEIRTDPRLINLIEQPGVDLVSGNCAELRVVDIPDEATDWRIMEYDGSEDVIYVLDGKIHYAL